jgi:hypothetical protein
VTLVLRAGTVPGLGELWDPRGSDRFEPLLTLPAAQIYKYRTPGSAQPASRGGR